MGEIGAKCACVYHYGMQSDRCRLGILILFAVMISAKTCSQFAIVGERERRYYSSSSSLRVSAAPAPVATRQATRRIIQNQIICRIYQRLPSATSEQQNSGIAYLEGGEKRGEAIPGL